MIKIMDHVQSGLSRLLQQYQRLPLLSGFLGALLTQFQDLEDAIYPLETERQLINAHGLQLDHLGEIIGLERNGLSDAVYSILLHGTIAENNSDTTIPCLANIVQTISQASSVFIKTPNSPGCRNTQAEVSIAIGSPQIEVSLYPLIQQIIQNALGAGISLVSISTFNQTYAFAMAGPQSWVGGFGDLNDPQPGLDGQFASLIYNNLVQ